METRHYTSNDLEQKLRQDLSKFVNAWSVLERGVEFRNELCKFEKNQVDGVIANLEKSLNNVDKYPEIKSLIDAFIESKNIDALANGLQAIASMQRKDRSAEKKIWSDGANELVNSFIVRCEQIYNKLGADSRTLNNTLLAVIPQAAAIFNMDVSDADLQARLKVMGQQLKQLFLVSQQIQAFMVSNPDSVQELKTCLRGVKLNPDGQLDISGVTNTLKNVQGTSSLVDIIQEFAKPLSPGSSLSFGSSAAASAAAAAAAATPASATPAASNLAPPSSPQQLNEERSRIERSKSPSPATRPSRGGS